jgi:heme-degrading monooxygenase HmoA
MIVRIWRGQTTIENAPAYCRHATERVFPRLAEIPGHRGAYLLTRHVDGQIEFLAVTLWDSIDSIRQFSADDPERAVVEPEARAVLSSFDDFVRHYELETELVCDLGRNRRR